MWASSTEILVLTQINAWCTSVSYSRKTKLISEERDGCRGGGEHPGGVTVPGEAEPGEHESFIDMQLTVCVCMCVCVCVHAKHRGDGMWPQR